MQAIRESLYSKPEFRGRGINKNKYLFLYKLLHTGNKENSR
jgi:hypothetical protein